ncbi:hypothetical protein B0H12DRAFT_1133646 [Mycena haematopus]|nr:hypothetical protein B0H12DRAFT_1133646 [Mycena haematopus]
MQLMETLPQVLYAIIDLHIKSGALEFLPPAMLDYIGGFTETLHKIHTYIQAQQDGNKIKNFFRQAELSTLLKDCQSGLDHTLEVFKASSRMG